MIVDSEEKAVIHLKKALEVHKMFKCIGDFSTKDNVQEKIEDMQPDLVFVRMKQMGINVYRLTSWIKEYNPNIKVVFLSSDKENAVDAFEYEADGFLSIPVDQVKIDKFIRKSNFTICIK